MKYQTILRAIHLFSLLALIGASLHANAGREGRAEFSIFSPYLNSTEIDFEGGARADIGSSAGFGLAGALNYTDQLAFRGEIAWNSFNYDALSILDDGNDTERLFGGKMDSWSILVGADYYFTPGQISPFVSANFGWTWIDSNIPNGPPGTICWWDPWWGYICSGYQNTHKENNMFYGAGLGLRFEVNNSTFFRVGYYEEWVDFNKALGSPSLSSFKFELGIMY